MTNHLIIGNIAGSKILGRLGICATTLIIISGCNSLSSPFSASGGSGSDAAQGVSAGAPANNPPINAVVGSGLSGNLVVYPGCAIPSGKYVNIYNATPATLSSLLATVQAGDVIYLASGNYGAVAISNRVYADFVSIMAEPGQTPILSSLSIQNSSHILASGLTIIGGVRSSSPGGVLVNAFKSDNIVFADNTVESAAGNFPWIAETTNLTGIDFTIAPSEGFNAFQDNCVAITGNSVRNVFDAIQIGGDQIGTDGQNYLIANNIIDHFAGDGVDNMASNILIKGNQISNSVDICNALCIHNDGIQSWNWNDALGITNSNVVIDSNIIMSQNIPNLTLAAADMHGITIFDGYWDNVSITNNIVLTSSWTGIAIAGVNGLNIVNNTVLAINLNGVANHSGNNYPYLTAGGTTHEGGTTMNVVVRNNIAPLISPTAAGALSSPSYAIPPVENPNVTMDHNLNLSAASVLPQNIFTSFSLASAQGDNLVGQIDLTLNAANKTNPAIGSGSATLMPAVNILGVSRNASSVNLGAY